MSESAEVVGTPGWVRSVTGHLECEACCHPAGAHRPEDDHCGIVVSSIKFHYRDRGGRRRRSSRMVQCGCTAKPPAGVPGMVSPEPGSVPWEIVRAHLGMAG